MKFKSGTGSDSDEKKKVSFQSEIPSKYRSLKYKNFQQSKVNSFFRDNTNNKLVTAQFTFHLNLMIVKVIT